MFSSTRSSFKRSSPTSSRYKSQFTVRPVPAGLNGQALQKYVILTLNQVPSVSSNTQFITRVDRLGAFESPSTAVITCTDPTTRNVFLSSKKHIQTRTGFISDAYLTIPQQRHREAMAHYYLLLKSSGYKPHWRVDRLCYMRDGKSATFSPFSIFGQRLLAGIIAKPTSTPSADPPPCHASTPSPEPAPTHCPPAPTQCPASPPAPPPPVHSKANHQPADMQPDTTPTKHQPTHPQPAPVYEDDSSTTSQPASYTAPTLTNPPPNLEKEPIQTSQDSLTSSQTATHLPHESPPSSPSSAPLGEATTTIHLTGQLLGLKHAILSYKKNPYRISGLPDEDIAPLQQCLSLCLDTISQASQFHPHMDPTEMQEVASDCIDALLHWAEHLESHDDVDCDAAVLFRSLVVGPFTMIFEQFTNY